MHQIRHTILIGPSTFAAIDPRPLDLLKDAGFKVVNNPYGRKLTREELVKLLKGVTGLIAGLETLDAHVLRKSELKVISRCGSGISNVDMHAAKNLGIKVFSTPDGPTSAVAELTLGALLSLLRMIPLMDRELHEGNWNKRIGIQLEGKTIVIIGYGRIGRRLATLLLPFKTQMLIVDPFLKDKKIKYPILTLEEALPLADIVTLHSSGNKKILGVPELNMIKPGAFLLNAARGDLVDEVALIGAIENGRIKGAWLDTFHQEPYSGPLTKYEQVILTPHIGSYTAECRVSMETEAVNNLLEGLRGK